MLMFWSLVFLLIALAAAALGFGGVAEGATWLAQILFFTFLMLAVVAFVANLFRPTRTFL